MLVIKRFLSYPIMICNICDRFIYCYDCKKNISCNRCNINLFYQPCKKNYCNNYCGGNYDVKEDIKDNIIGKNKDV